MLPVRGGLFLGVCWVGLLAGLGGACSFDSSLPPDASGGGGADSTVGQPDGGAVDATTPDGALTDAIASDASANDASTTDASTNDASTTDAAVVAPDGTPGVDAVVGTDAASGSCPLSERPGTVGLWCFAEGSGTTSANIATGPMALAPGVTGINGADWQGGGGIRMDNGSPIIADDDSLDLLMPWTVEVSVTASSLTNNAMRLIDRSDYSGASQSWVRMNTNPDGTVHCEVAGGGGGNASLADTAPGAIVVGQQATFACQRRSDGSVHVLKNGADVTNTVSGNVPNPVVLSDTLPFTVGHCTNGCSTPSTKIFDGTIHAIGIHSDATPIFIDRFDRANSASLGNADYPSSSTWTDTSTGTAMEIDDNSLAQFNGSNGCAVAPMGGNIGYNQIRIRGIVNLSHPRDSVFRFHINAGNTTSLPGMGLRYDGRDGSTGNLELWEGGTMRGFGAMSSTMTANTDYYVITEFHGYTATTEIRSGSYTGTVIGSLTVTNLVGSERTHDNYFASMNGENNPHVKIREVFVEKLPGFAAECIAWGVVGASAPIVDAQNIYWRDPSSIKQVDLAGGAVITLDSTQPYNIAQLGSEIFGASEVANELRKATVGSAGSGSALFTSQAMAHGIASDATHVWWTTQTHIRKGLPSGGSAIDVIATDSFDVEVDDTYYYWTDRIGGKVKRGVVASPATVVDLATASDAQFLALDTDNVYFTAGTTGQTIARVKKDGTGRIDLVTSGVNRYPVADGNWVYWTTDTAVRRARRDRTGSAEDVIAGLSLGRGVAVDSTHVYWADSNAGRVCRSPKPVNPVACPAGTSQIIDLGADWSTTQGTKGLYYESFNGATFANMTYDSGNDQWAANAQARIQRSEGSHSQAELFSAPRVAGWSRVSVAGGGVPGQHER